MSRVIVDLADPTPPYEQIRRGVLDQVRAGYLAPGDRLPTIRALARDLGIAAGTVARAYKELEEARVLTTGRGAGTRIASAIPPEALALSDGAGGDARVAVLGAEGGDVPGGSAEDATAGVGVDIDAELLELMADAVDAARSDGHTDAAILEAARRALARSPLPTS